METKQSLYDEMCHVITDYEEGNANGLDCYEMLVKLQNNWEMVITSEE